MISSLVKSAIVTAVVSISTAACGQATDLSDAPVAALAPGGGGGDKSLQTTLAEPAREGRLSLNVETLADGLDVPWAIAFLSDGDILVSERPGRIRLIRDGALVEKPVLGAPEVLAYNQGGMFDILPHPNFEENRVLFLAYAHGTRESNALRVSRAKFDGESITGLTPIYDAKPFKDTGHHFGGRLVWGPDDKLYMTIGEGSRYKEKSQDLASSFGAVVRLNEDGSVPADNPDFGASALPELFSKGHRNPQGFAYDAERDVFWSNEHGPRGGDELNIVQAGKNYGWPAASYGIDYNGARITPFTEYEGTTQPVYYWTPSLGVSGLAVYRGEYFSDWDGDLLVGALAKTALHRLIMEGDHVVDEERYLVGARVRDVRVGPDGAIYVATEIDTDDSEGKILRLTPR